VIEFVDKSDERVRIDVAERHSCQAAIAHFSMTLGFNIVPGPGQEFHSFCTVFIKERRMHSFCKVVGLVNAAACHSLINPLSHTMFMMVTDG
jgi:hypothetical protein